MQAESILLEPWYDLRLELPGDCVGRAMSDLTQMGGRFDPPVADGDRTVLSGSAPVAAMRSYAREVVSYSRGQGRLLCSLRGYEPCRNPEEVIAAAGYDPLRDVENSPDSVFCAHGAGFIVPWDQVERFMHLHPESGLAFARPDPAAPVRAAYRGTAAEEDELQAIFERTYGKPKSRLSEHAPKRNETTVNGQTLEKEKVVILEPPKTEYLLVDGYNIIFAWPDLQALARSSLEDARKALVELLANFHGFHPCELILVFDNANPYGYIAGARMDYHDGETETVAKAMTELEDGDKIDFICDYYSYDGTYQDSYFLGEQYIYHGQPTISNVYINADHVSATYRFTDIYNQTYWTPAM